MTIAVVKASVFLCVLMGVRLALTSNSVHLLWIVSTDVMYSVMTLQVICTFYLSERVNHYGACSGFVSALMLRALVGEPAKGLPDVLPLPWDKIQEDGHRYRVFPFRTAIMLITIGTILQVSHFAVWPSEKGLLGRINDTEVDTNKHLMVTVGTDEEEKDRRLGGGGFTYEAK